MKKSSFTSESVCAGHPDKICDRISDAILDKALEHDPYSRVAVETMVTKNRIIMAGEVTSRSDMDYEKIARAVVGKLGYTDKRFEFTDESPVSAYIHTQSPEIAQGVDQDGAGDQGMMFGYACDENDDYLPTPILLAHRLAEKIDTVRTDNILPYLRPDGKTQVTVLYENDKPVTVESVVIAVPHDESYTREKVKNDVYKKIILPVLEKYGFSISLSKVIFNGTGVWHIGGPAMDTGATGRKIIVDTYGGMARVGGGAFSGKDATKVDRSGAYAARFIAKNLVAHGLVKRCEVRLAYFIGAKKPIMQEIEDFGTAKKSKKVISDFMNSIIDTSVRGIIERLNLRKPTFEKTSAYGHFGRDGFEWERIVETS